ncbi:hypothetical protein ACSBR2_020557 [Camellia fascicularis]
MGAWKPRANITISPWSDNVFLFQFADMEDRRKALIEAPWSVMGFLLVLQPLSIGKPAMTTLPANSSPERKEVHKWVDKAEERVRNLVINRPVTERPETTCTMAPKDTTRTADPAMTDYENRDKFLRHDMVSNNGRSIHSGGVPLPTVEVTGVNDSTSQLGAIESILVGTDAVTDTPLGKVVLSSAQSSDGLGPRPILDIGIEEISPSSSLTNLSFLDQAIVKSMATFFQDLSIKRKAYDDLCEDNPPKRIKSTTGCANSKQLAVISTKTKKGYLDVRGRKYSKRRTSGRGS